MKKMHLSSRLLSLLLIVALLFSFAVPVGAANSGSNVSFKQVDNSAVTGSLQEGIPEEEPDGLDYADAEVVRVSIVLDKESTIEAGFSTMDIGKNQEAMSYRAGLQREQANMTASIEKAIGEKLDVAWSWPGSCGSGGSVYRFSSSPEPRTLSLPDTAWRLCPIS